TAALETGYGKRRDADTLLADARAFVEAGAYSLLLEMVDDEVAARITKDFAVPTVGIGAGPSCDGQVLVFHDVVGLSAGPRPKFVRRYADLESEATAAVARFFDNIRSGAFPSDAETYHMPEADAQEFLAERRV
ncbi:MAG: 3-methyl-2-oxobutanoate hydroxymethyltransferase, partial [Candidatus Eremiobacteraeota bacterium]|nr:3-methyl-2-oxobutanoate hydroxymethyltransferase [Candidatus Eremiobacteraeota bacterium]